MCSPQFHHIRLRNTYNKDSALGPAPLYKPDSHLHRDPPTSQGQNQMDRVLYDVTHEGKWRERRGSLIISRKKGVKLPSSGFEPLAFVNCGPWVRVPLWLGTLAGISTGHDLDQWLLPQEQKAALGESELVLMIRRILFFHLIGNFFFTL